MCFLLIPSPAYCILGVDSTKGRTGDQREPTDPRPHSQSPALGIINRLTSHDLQTPSSSHQPAILVPRDQQFANSSDTKQNHYSRNHVTRISLVLAPTHLRQGGSRVSRLHPQSRSHSQIRSQYLPSVFQGEEPGYRVHQASMRFDFRLLVEIQFDGDMGGDEQSFAASAVRGEQTHKL
ncbi:hypothetical protein XANCAGTX0491_003152 [Xanthoria calcicola]